MISEFHRYSLATTSRDAALLAVRGRDWAAWDGRGTAPHDVTWRRLTCCARSWLSCVSRERYCTSWRHMTSHDVALPAAPSRDGAAWVGRGTALVAVGGSGDRGTTWCSHLAPVSALSAGSACSRHAKYAILVCACSSASTRLHVLFLACTPRTEYLCSYAFITLLKFYYVNYVNFSEPVFQ